MSRHKQIELPENRKFETRHDTLIQVFIKSTNCCKLNGSLHYLNLKFTFHSNKHLICFREGRGARGQKIKTFFKRGSLNFLQLCSAKNFQLLFKLLVLSISYDCS